jgi:hypothetical protein
MKYGMEKIRNIRTNSGRNTVYMLTITNMAPVQNFEVTSNTYKVVVIYSSGNFAQK